MRCWTVWLQAVKISQRRDIKSIYGLQRCRTTNWQWAWPKLRIAGSLEMPHEGITFALLTDNPTIWSAGKPRVSHQPDVLSWCSTWSRNNFDAKCWALWSIYCKLVRTVWGGVYSKRAFQHREADTPVRGSRGYLVSLEVPWKSQLADREMSLVQLNMVENMNELF